MTDVRMDEIKKGDVVFLKEDRRLRENGIKASRLATVASRNIQRNTITLKFNALVDGKLTECRGYFKPADIAGFHVQGTPL